MLVYGNFNISDWTGKDEDEDDINVWEDNWDDENAEDDFNLQLRYTTIVSYFNQISYPKLNSILLKNSIHSLLISTLDNGSTVLNISVFSFVDLVNLLFLHFSLI
jgi:hypothetical protein